MAKSCEECKDITLMLLFSTRAINLLFYIKFVVREVLNHSVNTSASVDEFSAF